MAYTIIDPQSRVVIESVGTERILQVRADNGSVARITLSDLMLRELGYHCALWLRDRTGRDCFLPQGFVHPGAPNSGPLISPVRTRTRTL